jgi:hypothetical protein
VIDQTKRVDHRVDEHEQRRRHQQRECDPTEEVGARRALDRRRFGEVRRHLLQRREVEDHEKARLLPHRHQHETRERGALAAQPVVRGQSERARLL